jgi:hypothetical protein
MTKYFLQIVFLLIFKGTVLAQVDQIRLDTGFDASDSISTILLPSQEDLIGMIRRFSVQGEGVQAGGIITSIFNEALDSITVTATVNGSEIMVTLTDKGIFYLDRLGSGTLLDIHISHPEYHPYDTSFVVSREGPVVLGIQLVPKYKILLRGRVYSGKMPLENADVTVRYENMEFTVKTRGCYYDEDDFWNCLYHGMFKVELIATDPEDSIFFKVKKAGMKDLDYGMKFNEYTGEIMELHMRYESKLPVVPKENIALKLSFPLLSADNDWFVDLSYTRLVNTTSLRRLGLGLDLSLFVTTVTVEHPTLEGLGPSYYDSSYISLTIGPSAQFWLTVPEARNFGTYIGAVLAWHVGKPEVVFQPCIGSRLFLDLNKSISFELRYASFSEDIVNYSFNYYGNAYSSIKTQQLEKLHMNIGIQVIF